MNFENFYWHDAIIKNIVINKNLSKILFGRYSIKIT